jgi:excisionase family DNA binding protein
VIDLAAETLLTFEEAGKKLQVSAATLYRWITHGSSGVRLEAAKLGGRWRTSEEAIQRFSDRLTPKRESTSAHQTLTSMPNSRQRQRHLEWVDQQLDEIFGKRKCETCKAEIVAPKGTIPKNERVWCPKCLVHRKSATLGKRIRTFRWASMLSQQKLSDRTGIGIDKIRSYELDEKRPPETHLAKLIEVLGEELVSKYPGDLQSEPKPAGSAGLKEGS